VSVPQASPAIIMVMTGALLPYAQYVIFFTAGFLVIPTGRDFFAPGYPLLPGDDKLLEAMNRDPISTPCSAFMWKVFGLNFMMLSFSASRALDPRCLAPPSHSRLRAPHALDLLITLCPLLFCSVQSSTSCSSTR
jgi:hypothetical protein